jgi:hypothetical protein
VVGVVAALAGVTVVDPYPIEAGDDADEPLVAITGDGANLISGRRDFSANISISAAPPGIRKRWDCRCFTP